MFGKILLLIGTHGVMRATIGRSIFFLRWIDLISLVFVTTTECNYRCLHCLRDDGARLPQLPFEIVEKAVAGAKKFGIENIHLTGGEPFLYHRLDDLLALASHHCVPVTFSTNGSLLPQKAQLLEKHKKVIRQINISVDGPSAELHEKVRGAGAFRDILKAFEFCRRKKLVFGMLTCLTRWNFSAVADITKFAKKQKAAQACFTTALPCANTRERGLILDPLQRSEVHQELKRLQRLASMDLLRLFTVPVRVAESIYASADTVMCQNQSLKAVTVDVDGSLHFCCFLTVYDTGEDILRNLRVARLDQVSFDEAIQLFAKKMFVFLEERLLKQMEDPAAAESMDFTSCFYCSQKFGL